MPDVPRTPCGVPIPLDLSTPSLPKTPGLSELLAAFGMWVPMKEAPTVCPLVVDAAERKASAP
jgi:hypothetical protein